MNPIRKVTEAGKTIKYQFDLDATRFLVKNLSGGDIKVHFLPDMEGESWLIPDGAWQYIPGSQNGVLKNTVYVTATATSADSRGVEIEAFDYQLQRR